jgi:hypothetical protein
MKFLQFLLCLALSFPLFAQHSIKGIVLDNTNKDELIGVKVQLFSNQVLLKDTITDIEGVFVFEDIEKGQYMLQLQYPGFRNKSVEIVVENRGEEQLQIVLEVILPITLGSSSLEDILRTNVEDNKNTSIQQENNLRGFVTEKEGAPIVFGQVQLLKNGEEIRKVETDFDGFFEMEKLEAGKYQLRVSYLGFEPVLQTVTVEAGTDNEVIVFMKEKVIKLGEVKTNLGCGLSAKCIALKHRTASIQK